MMLHLLTFVACAAVAAASYANNLNYRSPSYNHPALGVAIHKVNKRHAGSPPTHASELNFTHGVASGDPYPHSVIIWTRCAPIKDDVDDNSTVSNDVPLYNPVSIQGQVVEKLPPASKAPICIKYKVATDQALTKVVDSGTAYTSSDVDYTLKVEAQKLKPYTQYYYQFQICDSDHKSPLGRTKTTPAPHDLLAKISLAVYSCSNFPFGFFNAYGNPVRKNSVDYVLHLGDYLYEYPNGEYGWGQSIGRIPLPDRIIYTLYDYRKRHATYRTDLDLLLSHSQFAWISDDHEVADNTYRDASSRLNNTEASFIEDGGVSVDQRKMNAVRAYFEWLPIRQVEMDDNLRIWRSFSIGSLLDLIMLDTRQYDRSITDLYWNTDYIHSISNDAGRSLMGSRQENWFYKQLIESSKRGAAWRVIGSQTVFSRLNESISYGNVNPLDYDAWDGYQSNRNRTFKTLYDNSIGNNIVISGDSHANWVSDLVWLDHSAYNTSTGKGSIGVEFAGTAVSSPSPYGQNITILAANNKSSLLVRDNRELQWSELYYRGYFELHISQHSANASYFGMPTVINRNPNEISLANFTVLSGANALYRNPVTGGGVVANGYLRGGKVVQTNLTHNTETGGYFISHEDVEDI
ncbi:hypothetical protein MMC29_002259 [Sticta canariensis]|nr:hypothetical protein [Sticta canariensis]